LAAKRAQRVPGRAAAVGAETGPAAVACNRDRRLPWHERAAQAGAMELMISYRRRALVVPAGVVDVTAAGLLAAGTAPWLASTVTSCDCQGPPGVAIARAVPDFATPGSLVATAISLAHALRLRREPAAR
jgi:hypothetical protein